MTTDYTKKIAEFVVAIEYEAIPAKALETAKTAIQDVIGVALAGSREAPSKIVSQLAREERASGEATLFGQGFKSSAMMAAFANGTAAHTLDFDNGVALMGQPTAGLTPAVFSLSETLGVHGRDLLTAYVAGFEVTTRLGRAMPEFSSKGGWHTTGVLGSLGAAVACAKLLRLSADKIRTALGIAASMASGIVWNFGTMTKPLHAGLASRNGVLAAKLAQSGFTANPSILEGTKGFFDIYCRELSCDLTALENLGSFFDLTELGVKIKPYPCGGLTHEAIDAVLEMRRLRGISPQTVEAINVGVTQYTYERIVFRVPETGIQGKFSMPYLLARALTEGGVGLDAFTDKAVRDPAVLRLAEKIEMEVDPGLKESKDGHRPCTVKIVLKDGRSFFKRADFAKGSRDAPLSPDELKGKFLECATRVLRKDDACRALEYLHRLESLRSVKPLCELLVGRIKRTSQPVKRRRKT